MEHASGKATSCQEVTKRSAGVALLVNFSECTPVPSANKHVILALKPREDITRSAKQGYQWPRKKDLDLCPPKIKLMQSSSRLDLSKLVITKEPNKGRDENKEVVR